MGIADLLFQRNQEKAQKNLEEGEQFLEKNKTKDGVITTASGLQYEILKEGDGQNFPHATSKVTCHYEGTLLNGKVFDSSYKRNSPATFGLNQVISGWTEGVQLMSPGSKFRFYIHPTMAYGNRQVGSDIGPNSTLIFDVELISFN